MTDSRPVDSEEAASLFSQMMGNIDSSDMPPDILTVWAVFKTFCEISLHCDHSGFIFHAGFRPTFIGGERVLDLTRYQVGFTRYWSDPADDSGATQLAECSLDFGGTDSLRKYEWVDIDVDASSDLPGEREDALREFIAEAESDVEYWSLLRSLNAVQFEFYCGPQ